MGDRYGTTRMLIQCALGLGALFAAQGRWRYLRMVGLTFLLWIPCFLLTAFGGLYLVGYGPLLVGSGGSTGLDSVVRVDQVISFVEAVVLSVWVLPWLERKALSGLAAEARRAS